MANTLARILFELDWHSDRAHHCEQYFAPKVNFWRDLIPSPMLPLETAAPGAQVEFKLPEGDSVPLRTSSAVVKVRPHQFDRDLVPCQTLEPQVGRFYPITVLKEVPGLFHGDYRPCRCVKIEEAWLTFDTNHPLAGREVTVRATLESRESRAGDNGGRCFDWVEEASNKGPGMQALDAHITNDFGAPRNFQRGDEGDDGAFYAVPRVLTHVDSVTCAQIRDLSARLLPEGAELLDLMSSSESHLSDTSILREVVGLGMNSEELAQNPRLTQYLVHDLNQTPTLPFTDQRFDAVTCHLSIEYLNKPYAVVAEVARVLRPGGLFLVTFSHRWFAPKAIKLWGELHDFERMALVLDYLEQSSAFEGLETLSLRGLERPDDDRYAFQLEHADPLFAVWGRVKG